MSYETVGKLIDKWLNDPGFRSALRENPEAVIKKMKINLSEEEWVALKKMDWNMSDEALSQRVNKFFS